MIFLVQTVTAITLKALSILHINFVRR